MKNFQYRFVSEIACALLLFPIGNYINGHKVHEVNEVHMEMTDADNFDPKVSDLENKEHLKEHLSDMKINLEEASPEQLHFYYFKLHDINGDSKLDGLEIYAAVSHMHHGDYKIKKFILDKNKEVLSKIEDVDEKEERINHYLEQSFTSYVDGNLKSYDSNNDGYISYIEYANALKKNPNADNWVKDQIKNKKQTV